MYTTIADTKNYVMRAADYFPPRISSALRTALRQYGDGCDEIRAVAGSDIRLTVAGKTVPTGIVCSVGEMRLTVMSLCGNSVYSHSETIKEGYVVTSDGVRAGVSGRAVTEGGKILTVADISSVVIRIPSRRPGFADELYGVMKRSDFRENVLIYSPPAGGKTTLLRELAFLLSTGEEPVRTAVVDTRFEISEGIDGCHIVTLSGYPRAKGIEIAERTMSPQVIICDEIANDADLDAVDLAAGCGAAVVASCHSDEKGESRIMREAKRRGTFGIFYGVSKDGAGKITIRRADGSFE